MNRWLALGALAVVVSVAACSSGTDDGPGLGSAAPGVRALESDNPTCKQSSDCATGEMCLDGICQMDRCGSQAYASSPPLGAHRKFAVDRELVVAADAGAIGYEPTDRTFSRRDALSTASTGVIDVAGGDFLGSRPELAAIARAGSREVLVGDIQLDVGFVPVAIAAADIDDDGIDELLALSAVGDLATCKVTTKTCTRTIVDGLTGKDLTAADVDGDGHIEPIVLGDRAGKSSIVVVNLDHATTGQPETVELATGRVLSRISAAVVDPKAPAEIVALEDGGYGDFVSDSLRFFADKDDKLLELGTKSIAKTAVDVLAADLDGDDVPEIIVLEKSAIEVYVPNGATDLSLSFSTTLDGATNPTRLSLADLDGDSPAGTLVGTVEKVPGPVVPLAILVYPPYSRTYSDGTSQIVLGNRESTADTESSTLTLKASVAIGFEAEFPGIAKVSVMPRVEVQIARTHANTRTVTIGDKFSVDAKPELEGPDNGVAVLASACYHAYTYKVEDPAGRLGDRAVDGRLMSLFVPVGGQTSLWSLKRYNVLAQRLGTLPVVNVPYAVGDTDSYPKTRTTLAGAPVPTQDLLFTTQKSYRASDVARVGWSLDVVETQAQTETSSLGISLRGQLKAGPVTIETEVGANFSQSYTVAVGKEASFSGTIPPVRNDPRTPEDEHELHSYSFAPVVYRDRYKTPGGQEGGYYVVTYTTAP